MLNDSDDTIPLLRQGAAGDQHALGALWNRYRERLKRMVRLRLDRRLQGRLDPSDVLQQAFIDFARRAGEFAERPEVSFFLWLRTLTGQRLQMLHRQHLGAKMRDVAREISLHRGPMPQATSERVSASVPEATPMPCFAPLRAAIWFSSVLTTSPPLKRELSMTATIASSISAFSS